jgi:hypothetical protein
MGLKRETYESGKTTFTTTLHINLCPLLVFNIFVLFFLPANESRSAARPTCPAKNSAVGGIRTKDLDSNQGPHAREQSTFTTTLHLNLCNLHALTSFVPSLASSQRRAARAYVSASSASWKIPQKFREA